MSSEPTVARDKLADHGVIVRPLAAADADIVARWLAAEENYRWLDFGAGRQSLDAVTLNVMARRDAHLLRVFAPGRDEPPVGLVALTDIARNFKRATLWYVLGDKKHSGKGYTSRAASSILTTAFQELGLNSVNAWTVDSNIASVRVLERHHFRLVGRQRQCHLIDGRFHDRLLFDLLAREHTESRESS